MTTLFDILDRDDYESAVANKHIKVQTHPTLPYLIHNYTDAATWDEAWTPATLACRGLITDAETGEVLARPFRKFFNHDQAQAPSVGLDDEVVVFDKADGSLGILYPLPDGTWAIATRGSFASDQAIWATDLYLTRYADTFTPTAGLTYLFEIIFPENKIVVDYGDRRDLVLLGAVNIATGETVAHDVAFATWPGLTVDVFPHTTLREVLDAPERRNAEGFVVWDPKSDERVKIKFAEYKRLHKLLTGVNARHIWEVLAAGDDPNIIFASAPDEFHIWMRTVITDLTVKFDTEKARISEVFTAVHADVVAEHGADFGRREFAIAASKSADRAALFLLLDDRSADDLIWKSLRPAGETSVRKVSSDSD